MQQPNLQHAAAVVLCNRLRPAFNHVLLTWQTSRPGWVRGHWCLCQPLLPARQQDQEYYQMLTHGITTTLFTVVSVLSVAGTSLAQHDFHRNATQAIANKDVKSAAHVLKQADANDPETHFVRTMLALQQGNVEAAQNAAADALIRGLPFARFVAGPRDLLAPLYETSWFEAAEARHRELHLLHGPMVGAVTDTSASFWVRTVRETDVQVVVGDRKSSAVRTSANTDFTAVAVVEGLQPGTRYPYQLLIGSQRLEADAWKFQTFPTAGQPAQFSVAFGGGAGYLPKKEYMWDTIRARQPLALLMLGDNVYIDQPEHLLCQHYCYYRRQTRPEWRRLVASTATFAIYDDHDFGTNDCVPGPEIETPPWKRVAWNVFRQNWVNPGYGGGPSQPGCWFDFQIADVHFIMLDGRYYRDRKGGSMLGPVQKAWLLDKLKNSTGTFKVLASPVPWTAGVKPGSKDPWDGFPAEREEIFAFIQANKINGVVLIAADRHRTDLRKTTREDGYDFYEFESSRLTNRHYHPVVPTPGLVWGYNKTCSFALMQFDTTANDPQVTFQCVTIDGDTKHRFELTSSRLK
jgi:alkaline phosphatase D